MERISLRNEVMFMWPGFDLKARRARPSSELKVMADSPTMKMRMSGGVAVIPVIGAINRGEGWYGETDINDLITNCQRAMSDPSISSVVFDFDSPGGTAVGCHAAASAIAALTAVKPTVSHCVMCCSAAYYMASQTSKIVACGDGMVGSIGTTTELVDASEYYAKQGIKFTEVNTGEYKGVGNPTQPVSQEDIDYVQGMIDDLFSGFVKAVSSGRGMSQQKVKDLQAKVFIGANAVNAGLADSVGSMSDCYSMAGKLGAKKGKMNANNLARLELAKAHMKISSY